MHTEIHSSDDICEAKTQNVSYMFICLTLLIYSAIGCPAGSIRVVTIFFDLSDSGQPIAEANFSKVTP